MVSDSYLDDLSLIQDVLDEVANGRTEGHPCPFCGGGPLDVKADEARVAIKCPGCRKTVEGRFA